MTLLDSYAKSLDVKARIADAETQWEYTRVSAACNGFQMQTVEDELDRIEHGRVLLWDPEGTDPGTSWLYRDGRLPEVDNKDRSRAPARPHPWFLAVAAARRRREEVA